MSTEAMALMVFDDDGGAQFILPPTKVEQFRELRERGLTIKQARAALGIKPVKRPMPTPAPQPPKDLKSDQDIGTLERRIKAVVQTVMRQGTNFVERVDVVTAAHRIFLTGSPELLAAAKYQKFAEVAQGALEDGADRSGGGSTPPWSRMAASERQLDAMARVRRAHELTRDYNGARILPMVLVDGLKIAQVAKNLRVRKPDISNGLEAILGILADADAKW